VAVASSLSPDAAERQEAAIAECANYFAAAGYDAS